MVFDDEAAKSLVKELRDTFRTGRTRSIQWREDQIRNISRMCEENEAQIIDALASDLGKPRFESWLLEVNGIIKTTKHFLKNLKKWLRPQKVSTDAGNQPARSEIVPEPYGVVLIIGPWNFPFMLSIEPLIGAIASGNTVVLKPSEVAPATSALISRLVPLYLDNKAVHVVEGGAEVCTALLNQRWDNIFYTGGTSVGRIIASAAAKHLTPVTLELGGKNPAIVDASTNIDVTARRIVSGRFLNNGQLCLSPDYVLVDEKIVDELTDKIKKVIVEFYGEEPIMSQDLPHIVNIKHFNRIMNLLTHPDTKDRIVHGGKSDEEKLFIAPTVLRDIPWDAPIMQEEVFGPILTIQTVKSVDEAIEIVNDREKPLALYIFSKNVNHQQYIVSNTSSGGVCINDTVLQVGNPELPFGGVGESGLGKYHGRHSIQCFSHMKSVMHKSFFGDVPQRYPPSTPQKQNFIRAVFSGKFIRALLILLGIMK